VTPWLFTTFAQAGGLTADISYHGRLHRMQTKDALEVIKDCRGVRQTFRPEVHPQRQGLELPVDLPRCDVVAAIPAAIIESRLT
jgi:hypothetical protein